MIGGVAGLDGDESPSAGGAGFIPGEDCGFDDDAAAFGLDDAGDES